MADSLATIRARVAVKAGNVSNRDSLITENINEAILQVIQEGKPQEMWTSKTFSASSGTSSYAFTAMTAATDDVLWVLFVRDTTDDVPLYHASYQIWNRYKQDTSSTSNLGAPRRWIRYQNKLIIFSRIPDSATRTIRVDYLKRPTRLAADADAFPLNDEWKRPVEELAAGLTLMDLNSYEKAQGKIQTYYSILERRMVPEGEEDASPEGSAFIPSSNLNLSS